MSHGVLWDWGFIIKCFFYFFFIFLYFLIIRIWPRELIKKQLNTSQVCKISTVTNSGSVAIFKIEDWIESVKVNRMYHCWYNRSLQDIFCPLSCVWIANTCLNAYLFMTKLWKYEKFLSLTAIIYFKITSFDNISIDQVLLHLKRMCVNLY